MFLEDICMLTQFNERLEHYGEKKTKEERQNQNSLQLQMTRVSLRFGTRTLMILRNV